MIKGNWNEHEKGYFDWQGIIDEHNKSHKNEDYYKATEYVNYLANGKKVVTHEAAGGSSIALIDADYEEYVDTWPKYPTYSGALLEAASLKMRRVKGW